MTNITANALLNLKEEPASLTVHGSIITYRADDKVAVVKANPQGFVEEVLVLDLTVLEGSGPMKGTPKPFFYVNDDPNASTFSKVTIRYGEGQELTIDVESVG